MATLDDLDRIARSFPGVTVGAHWDDPEAYLLVGKGGKGFARRRSPARDAGVVDSVTGEPFEDLIVIATATPEAERQALDQFPNSVFTIPHFSRTTNVLVHLDAITAGQLEDLLELAWRSKQKSTQGR